MNAFRTLGRDLFRAVQVDWPETGILFALNGAAVGGLIGYKYRQVFRDPEYEVDVRRRNVPPAFRDESRMSYNFYQSRMRKWVTPQRMDSNFNEPFFVTIEADKMISEDHRQKASSQGAAV